MENWDPVAFRTLLRTTSQRLGQLQERKDAQSQLARRDIATYLSHGQLALARAKAAALIQEDVMADLLEELEMFVGTLGRHVGDLGFVGAGNRLGLRMGTDVNGDANGAMDEGAEKALGARKQPRWNPVFVEAAASIIHAAPSSESKDLHRVREILIQRLGPAFAQTASARRNNHVSPRITQILASPAPTASKMDDYLANVAKIYGIGWVPEPRREDLVSVISEILCAEVSTSPIVDLPRLREICARGLPDDPPWVRPRIWRLLFGTLPVLRTTWTKESQKQRDGYYDLVRRLLDPLASFPAPTDPLSPTDALLTRISDSLSNVSSDLFVLLGNEPKSIQSGRCPLDPTAPDTIRISCASNLDKRLAVLKGDSDVYKTPEIRLDSDPNSSPPPPPSSTEAELAPQPQRRPTTLLPSKAYNAPPAHRAHLSALSRLLYIHNTLNPAIQSPHIPWLLVPLYSALVGETDPDNVAHAEADTFWVFEALVGEIAELEEEQGGKVWMRTLSERIKWADSELAASLHATGLDPILPHYSYRWLAPLLTQTLPLSSIFPVWDVLFARPMRTRDANPKLEHLVDVCTTLLVRARTPLFRLGKPAQYVPGLWTQEHAALPPPSPLRPWELSDAFKEGNALLMSYPIDAAGGIDRILQSASDLSQRRIEERDREKERERENVGFGARIRQQMWKGFTNQVADQSPEDEEEEEEDDDEDEDEEQKEVNEPGEHDDGNETETPAVPTLTSRLANTVWRGITNQSSMDDEMPSPPSPLSEGHPPTAEEQGNPPVASSSSQASLWDYAGKLKDSDTVAAFAKVSTNWRAKALDAWRVRKGSNATVPSLPATPIPPNVANDISPRQNDGHVTDALAHRRGSFPAVQGEGFTQDDPPRPAFFRSPRESFLPQPRRPYSPVLPSSPHVHSAPPSIQDSDNESSASSFIHRAGASLASFAAFQSSSSARSTPKSVPKPLMLNTRDSIVAHKSPSQPYYPSARSDGARPEQNGAAAGSQWADVLLAAQHRRAAFRQESVSSTSSLSQFSEAAIHQRSTYSSPFSPGYMSRNAGARTRSDYDSDGSTASRRVPLNRKSVSPMALASRAPHLPWNSPSLSAGTCSPVRHPLSNGSVTANEVEVETGAGGGTMPEEESATTGGVTRPMTGLDSPTTISSPPIPPTPLMTAVAGPGVVRIVDGASRERCLSGTSSISTLSETNEVAGVMRAPLEAPAPNKLIARKKTPPPPQPMVTTTTTLGVNGDTMNHLNHVHGSLYESEQSESSMERTPSNKVPMRLRSKRYTPRPPVLRLHSVGGGLEGQQQQPLSQRTPSPKPRTLARVWPGTGDGVHEDESYLVDVTEDGADIGVAIGGEGLDVLTPSKPPFVRRSSKEARSRKISTGSRENRRARDSTSGASEGDDEGYGDLLSAYESEEGSRE